ncbi:MAG TPA: hypothetical protein VFP87_09190, partial [Chitinophagaceae bacterium]|nr:hypothetical protein [Chitinophagaceae bacterium]
MKWQYILEGENKVKTDDFLFNETGLSQLPDFVIAGMRAPERVYLNASFNNFGNLTLASVEPLSDEHFDILLRFAKVFDLTYTRFNDLKQAEAQAREAQIQLALERVRARTMAMQRSDELRDAASLLFRQLEDLGVKSWSSGFNIWQVDGRSATINMCNPDGSIATPYHLPHTEDIFFIRICEARQRGDDLLVMETGGKELEETYNYMFSLPEVKKVLGGMEDTGFQIPKFQVNHCAFFSQGYLMFITYEPVPEMWDVFKRFAKVFEQTYTRFLDLQTAEAQARESQIQLALERVRARTMAMQKSEELQDTALLLFQQVKSLGVPSFACGFNIWDEDRKTATAWMAREDALQPPFKTSSSEDVFLKILEAAQRGDALFVEEQGGEKLEEHYRYMTSIPVFKDVVQKMSQAGLSIPTFQIIHCAFFSHGYLMFISYEPVPEAHDIFKRFAKVFEQTYTRFLDLQKAEAQAREAKIEAALEKVRSRTMAMQRSDELSETAAVLFQEFKKLGEEDLLQITIGIYNEPEGLMEFRVTSWAGGGEQINEAFNLSIEEPTLLKPAFNAWKEQRKSIVIDLSGKELEDWLHYRNAMAGVTVRSQDTGGRRVVSFAFFSKGHISFSSAQPKSPETLQLLERFAGVFDLTYTRFLDLQKAEAQARESQIQLAMERVRARTMAMQRSDELAEAASLLFKQVSDLGIKAWSTAFQIWNADDISSTAWASAP